MVKSLNSYKQTDKKKKIKKCYARTFQQRDEVKSRLKVLELKE